MSFLSTTRSMFSFVVLLYLLGFALMMSRWVAVEQTVLEDECEPLRERHGAAESIDFLNINAQELPTVYQHDESLIKVDNDLPILNKDVATDSKESLQESKVKVPVQKTGKKLLKEKTKASTGSNAKKGAIVATKHSKENLNPQKGNDPEKKLDQQLSEAKANEGLLPTQKSVVNDKAKESVLVAKKSTKANLNAQKGNVPENKLDQKSKAKANEGLLPTQKPVVNEKAKESVLVAKKNTKANLNQHKGNVRENKLDQKSKAKANEDSMPTQKPDVNDNARESVLVAKKNTKANLNAQKGNVPEKKLDQISKAKVTTKSKKAPAAKSNNANVATVKPVPDKPKEEPPKPAKNPRQLRRGQRDLKLLWTNEQAERRATLRQACDRLRGIDNRTVEQTIKQSKRSFWPFIVEDRYRLLYTYISKVGSTNWKSAFLVLQGKYKNVENVPGKFAHARSLVKLSSLPEDEIQRRLDDFTNFIFVRHPFARVLSAYRSKFLQPNYSFQRHTGARIIKMYRKNATKEALKTGSDVSFYEFVQYIVNSKVINFDGHWQPIYKMVLPCTVRFDFIGKLETGEEDAKFILEETKVDHLVHFMPTKRNVSHDDSIFNHFYSQIPNNDLVKLYKVYEPDFTLFGYEVPQSIKSLIQVTG